MPADLDQRTDYKLAFEHDTQPGFDRYVAYDQ